MNSGRHRSIRIVNRRIFDSKPLDGQSGSPNSAPPHSATHETSGVIVQVLVRDNNIDQALRVLKKKMQREGMFRDMKAKRFTKSLRKGQHARNPKPFDVPAN